MQGSDSDGDQSGARAEARVEAAGALPTVAAAASVSASAGRVLANVRTDRRAEPTSRFSRYSLFGGRRRRTRRAEEAEGSFVDIYGHRLWLLLLWTALMNVADCFFTLWHLQGGGIELNPIAAALLGTGRSGFVLWKSMLIALALLVLCLHKNFQLARLGLWAAAGGYTLLTAYHLALLAVP